MKHERLKGKNILISTPVVLNMEVNEISFEGANAKLFGDVFVPDNEKKNNAAVIVCHGFGASRYDNYDIAKTLANEGFLVFAYDARGHNKSTGEYDTELMCQDLYKAIDYLKENYDFDEERLGVFGHSMGGYYSSITAADNENIKVTVSLAGPTSMYRCVKELYPRFASILEKAITYKVSKFLAFPLRLGNLKIKHFGKFLEKLLDKDQDDSRDYVSSITPRAYILLHGTKDRIVKPHHSKELYKLAEEPKELYWIPGGGHIREVNKFSFRDLCRPFKKLTANGYLDKEVREIIVKKTVNTFKKYLLH